MKVPRNKSTSILIKFAQVSDMQVLVPCLPAAAALGGVFLVMLKIAYWVERGKFCKIK